MKQCPRGQDPGLIPLAFLISRKQVKFLVGWQTARKASGVGKRVRMSYPPCYLPLWRKRKQGREHA